ncbi:hypothetical protein ACQEVB_03600 [Pseudonocardia sp. CA-107938]|uniref:hypothetical protein n=1 Tax=Pseudonocardia sp. CA-107938 TaxID=3240021 RepID=UPI003D8E0900
MPIAFIFDSDKVGEAEYDNLMKALGLESLDAPTPPGSIAHLAGPKPDGGWRVVDVWESEEAANAFYGSPEFAPVSGSAEEMGITTTPWRLHRTQVSALVDLLG